MSQVLGRAAGNALEVRETIDFLRGDFRDARLLEVTVALTSELLQIGGLATDDDDAREQIGGALASGAAAERFADMVVALGGPGGLLDRPDDHLPTAPVVTAVLSDREGVVQTIDTRALGVAVMRHGGGRRRADDTIDYAVGGGAPICRIHAQTAALADQVAADIRDAITLDDTTSDTTLGTPPLIYERVGA